MPRNGSGTYSLPVAPFVGGTVISATDVNADFSDIAAAMTDSVARDGQTAMTGPLNMGANGLTNVSTISTTGAVAFGSSMNVTGAATLLSTLNVTGAATLKSTLDVTGATTIAGKTTLNGQLQTNAAVTLGTTVTINGNVTANANTVVNTFEANGAAQFKGTVTVPNGTTGTQALNISQFASAVANPGYISFPPNLRMAFGIALVTLVANQATVSFGTTITSVLSIGAWNASAALTTSGVNIVGWGTTDMTINVPGLASGGFLCSFIVIGAI